MFKVDDRVKFVKAPMGDRYVGQVAYVRQYDPPHFGGMMQVEFADGHLTWFAINGSYYGFERA